MTAPQQFPAFLREHGLIRLDELPSPEPTLVKKLPVSSTLHYLGSEDAPQLDASDPLMLGYQQVVRYMNIIEYPPETIGGTHKVVSMSPINSTFDKTHRGFKVAKEFNELKMITSSQLMVMNYGYLDMAYRYVDTPGANYLQYQNKLKTLIATIKKIESINSRNHFVVINVPANLVPRSLLDKDLGDDRIKLARAFPGEDEQMLRELWQFLIPPVKGRDGAFKKPMGSVSIFDDLTNDELKRVNLIYKSYDGKYTIINMGYLRSWVRGQENLTFMKTVQVKGYVDVQKYLLRGLMVMQNINITGASEQAKEEALRQKAAEEEANARSEEEASEKDERFLQDQDYNASALRDQSGLDEAGPVIGADGTRTTAEIQELNRKNAKPTDPADPPAVDEAALNADLDALEKLYASQQLTKDKREKAKKLDEKASAPLAVEDQIPEEGYTSDIPESAEDIKAKFFTPRSTEAILTNTLDRMGEEGRITATEYRKRLEMIKNAGNILDPYGSGKPISQAKIVTKEELAITDADAALSVPPTVIDKSMARASLSVIARKYNTKTIYKDTLAMVQSLQKGGVVIKDHRVERRSEITGDYDVHTLELMPLSGMPSIISFRTPRILEDGTFIAKNTKYSMRRQMVDVPIRKIGSNRVGLSSYYGKTFVDRAVKKADSSLEFVLTRLDKGTINPDEHLRDVTPGDVFDNYFEAPYFYAGISTRFKSFKAGDYTFDFNQNGFRQTLDPNILKALEKDGARICGWRVKGKKSIVIIDRDSNFFAVNEGSREFIGDIYDILKLERMNAPVDFAEVKVYSVGIPVGIFLARQMGFRALVKLLGASHRLVEGRQQKNLQPFEYVVQFRDVAYIFDRREGMNSLVLAGFQQYGKDTRLYDAELFDSKDIYHRMLESRSLGPVYLGEMDNMNDMFIEPITERILIEMGEPTTFNGLLIRSCELLQTYYYPASQDANYQRIRGYDRVPGFAYMEITRAIRNFRMRNRTGRAKVDISPFQIWSTITRDSSVKQAEDINPIQSLKISQEAVTYVGEGGRGKESMNRQSRAYTESNLGVLSEASVDSSDVAINSFLAADPGFANTDGIAKTDRPMAAANLMSTSVLLAPYAENDDMKRRG